MNRSIENPKCFSSKTIPEQRIPFQAIGGHPWHILNGISKIAVMTFQCVFMLRGARTRIRTTPISHIRNYPPIELWATQMAVSYALGSRLRGRSGSRPIQVCKICIRGMQSIHSYHFLVKTRTCTSVSRRSHCKTQADRSLNTRRSKTDRNRTVLCDVLLLGDRWRNTIKKCDPVILKNI